MEFIETFMGEVVEQKQWEFYLNKLTFSDMTWEEFQQELKIEVEPVNDVKLKTAVSESYKVSQTIKPTKRNEVKL